MPGLCDSSPHLSKHSSQEKNKGPHIIRSFIAFTYLIVTATREADPVMIPILQ